MELISHRTAASYADVWKPERECVFCGSPYVQKWGRTRAGKGRFRCRACRRSFSGTAGADAAPISSDANGGPGSRDAGVATARDAVRLPARIATAAQLRRDLRLALRKPEPLRTTACRLGIHPRTVLRARHRDLRALSDRVPEPLEGEVLFTPVRVVMNGFWRRAVPFCVHVASTWTGEQRIIATHFRPTVAQIEALVRRHVAPSGAAAFGNGRLCAFGMATRRIGLGYVDTRHDERRTQWHAQRDSAGAHGRAFFRWLRQFRGIGWRQLPDYVAWYEALQEHGGEEGEDAWLRRWDAAAGLRVMVVDARDDRAAITGT